MDRFPFEETPFIGSNENGPIPVVEDIPFIGINENGLIPVVVRMEINDMYNDKPLFNLYILALDRMMKVPKDQRTSYYAISGIHGTDQVYNGLTCGKQSGAGYSEHNTIRFPCHLRIHVALYETSLVKYAKQVVSEFNNTDRPLYEDALKRFRVPYWDWASNASLPNWILFEKSITVYTPRGQQLMDNPLYAFRDFIPNDPNLRINGNSTKLFSTVETLRSPAFVANNLLVSQPANVARLLHDAQCNLRNFIYRLFLSTTQWKSFASQSGGSNSLESIHSTLHTLVGGYANGDTVVEGHMTSVRLAAFDPVFWLHHCNVDRQFAIWQVINPNQYFITPEPLSPFWDYRRDSYFTVASSRRVTDFGYTYPELQQTTDANRMRQLMLQKYEDSTSRNTIAQAANILSESEFSDKSTSIGTKTIVTASIFDTDLHTPADPAQLASKAGAQLLNTTDSYNEYQAAINLPSDAATGSFSIYLFFGSYTASSSRWTTDANYVGSTDCFTLGSQSAMRIDIQGSISLTIAVISVIGRPNSSLTSMRVDDVGKFLKKNLKYEVQSSSDVKVDKERIKIQVQTACVKLPMATQEDGTVSSAWGPWSTIFTLK